jgi:hypothetical protein
VELLSIESLREVDQLGLFAPDEQDQQDRPANADLHGDHRDRAGRGGPG